MNSTERIAGLDALRGLAVILMLEQHLGKWLWEVPWINIRAIVHRHPILIGSNAIGGLAAPLFIMLAGIGAALLVKNRGGSAGRAASSGILVKRGIIIMIMGYMLNLITPAWFSPLSWYVLHLIGFSMLTAPVFLRMSGIAALIAGSILFFVTPVFQYILDVPSVLNNSLMAGISSAGNAFRVMLVQGHFPVLPWLGVFVFGTVSGKWISGGNRRRLLYAALSFIVAGGMAGIAGLLFPGILKSACALRYLKLSLRLYPVYLPLMLMLTGSAMLVVLAATADRISHFLNNRSPIVLLGRCSLSVFIVHIFIFRQASLWMGLYKSLGAYATGGITILVVILALFLSVAWYPKGFRYGAGWLLRKVVPV